jgi:hypothetical protein
VSFCAALGLALAVSAVAVAAKEVTGGGWIPSLNGNGARATYGFDVVLPDDTVLPAEFSGTVTLQDRAIRTAAFPNGVNLHASQGVVDSAGVDGHAAAILTAPVSFAQRGNGGQAGTLVAVVVDTANGGKNKGDQVYFVVYPFSVTEPSQLIGLGQETFDELFGSVPVDQLNSAIYINNNTIAGGGSGGGNLNVDLGGSWVALMVLVALAASGLIWRAMLRRPAEQS